MGDILEIALELEVLEAGVEEGGVGARVEAVAGHGGGDEGASRFINARPGLETSRENIL